MPFASYLSTFRPPPHANAYRTILQEQKIDFAQRQHADVIAARAARMFLPPGCVEPAGALPEDCGILALNGMPQIKLQLITDRESAAVTTLADKFEAIARDRTLDSEVALGRAVLNAIAEAIRPALETGAVGRTEMAQAAALEIAAAIANRRTLSIGWRGAVESVYEFNPVGCKLGTPSQWGVAIVAQKGDGRVTLCESTAWDRYHWNGVRPGDAKAAGKRKAPAGPQDDHWEPEGGVAAVTTHNVTCQAGPVLVADVQTTFRVKTSEWWLTRVLLRRKDQRATVAAKIEMVAFESSEPAVHEALAFEDGGWVPAVFNWLARLCRFMRGISIGRLPKREYARLNKFRPLRDPVPLPPPHLQEAERNWDHTIAQCQDTVSRKAEWLGKDARRAGRRSGTWSGRGRHAGRVDLHLHFLSRVAMGGKEQTLSYASAPADAVRAPVYEALPTAGMAEALVRSTLARHAGSDRTGDDIQHY